MGEGHGSLKTDPALLHPAICRRIEDAELTVVMEYEPQGFLEKAGDILGVPSGHVEESLKSFRELIESKGREGLGDRLTSA